jgi:hypothetical protein
MKDMKQGFMPILIFKHISKSKYPEPVVFKLGVTKFHKKVLPKFDIPKVNFLFDQTSQK